VLVASPLILGYDATALSKKTSNYKCRLKTEGPVNAKGSRVPSESGNISVTVQNKNIVTTNYTNVK